MLFYLFPWEPVCSTTALWKQEINDIHNFLSNAVNDKFEENASVHSLYNARVCIPFNLTSHRLRLERQNTVFKSISDATMEE